MLTRQNLIDALAECETYRDTLLGQRQDQAVEIDRLRKIEAAAVACSEHPVWNDDQFYGLMTELQRALRGEVGAGETVKGMMADILELRKDAERLNWLEQHAWATERECFDFVDAWRTPDGKRHGAGLRAAIDAWMGHNDRVDGREMTDEQKATAYYKAGMLKQAPPWVPATVRVLREQFGDPPFLGAGVAAGEHECQCNKWGAVSVTDRAGSGLGLRLDEFEPLTWRENVTANAKGQRGAEEIANLRHLLGLCYAKMLKFGVENSDPLLMDELKLELTK